MFQFLRIPPFIWNIDPPIAPKNHLTALTSKDNCADFTVRFTRKDFLSWLRKAKSSEERARARVGGKPGNCHEKSIKYMGVPWYLIERMLFSGDYGFYHQFWWSLSPRVWDFTSILEVGCGWVKIFTGILRTCSSRSMFFKMGTLKVHWSCPREGNQT